MYGHIILHPSFHQALDLCLNIHEKRGHVRSLGYGPEPNLDVYAVWATIQLMLGQE